MDDELDGLFAADVSAEREVVGEQKELPEYLYPVFLMVLLLFIAFTYVPFALVREQTVLDRLRVETTLEAVVAAKLIYLTTLMLFPIAVFHLAAAQFGYAVNSLAPQAVLVLLLTFLFLSTVSMTIVILTRFNAVGQFVNVVLLLGLTALSALAFPLGFFSSLRTTVAQLLPTYYAMVQVRSVMLKGSDLSVFADWFLGLVAITGLALLALKLAIVQYRRVAP
jgi:ABC-2 type transport system permease protein